jgi:hypothetical protein
MKRLLLLGFILWSACGWAAGPNDLLAAYAEQAREAEPGFSGFSAERGQAFYFSQHRIEDGSRQSCASCHHEDPRKETFAHQDEIPCRACHGGFARWPNGVPRMHRQILAFAPSENPERFTDQAKVDKWFGFNCTYLLGRDCTPQEKGDLITWLLQVGK